MSNGLPRSSGGAKEVDGAKVDNKGETSDDEVMVLMIVREGNPHESLCLYQEEYE